MKAELMEATRNKIAEARKSGNAASPRDLWIEFYGAETPTIEDFADVCRSVDEDGQTDPVAHDKTPKVEKETPVKPNPKAEKKTD